MNNAVLKDPGHTILKMIAKACLLSVLEIQKRILAKQAH